MTAMKSKHTSACRFALILAFISAVSLGAVVAQPPGHLVILRSPNFGWNLAFNLEIDGRPAGNIVQGRHFHAWLPAGHHVLTVYKVPSVGYTEPTSVAVNIQPGWNNVFTAIWDSNLVYLRPSGTFLSPGATWQNRGDVY
jgi:hypothetical protein